MSHVRHSNIHHFRCAAERPTSLYRCLRPIKRHWVAFAKKQQFPCGKVEKAQTGRALSVSRNHQIEEILMTIAIQSPMRSHAFNPNILPLPEWQFDLVENVSLWPNSRPFEAVAAAREQDRHRARHLKKSIDPTARQLGQWLEAATDQRLLPLSCASSFYMRTCRRKLLGSLMKTIYGMGCGEFQLLAVTLIHPAWLFKAGDLHRADPKAIRKQLRRYLERAGVINADGILWMALHGEFNGTGYQLHYHGVASGKKAELINTLYGRFGFISTADIQHPVETSDVYDVTGWLSYCLKSYWQHKAKYIGKDGKTHTGKKQQLRHQQHEEYLMWMSKQHLLNLIIESGFPSKAVGNGGER
jgi:hypothetical protein